MAYFITFASIRHTNGFIMNKVNHDSHRRLLSVDVMRGITVGGMILVNNPGSWSHVYAPLRHAEWNGLTPTDLVFPFFMFIMGVSMCLSLARRGMQADRSTLLKVLRRSR